MPSVLTLLTTLLLHFLGGGSPTYLASLVRENQQLLFVSFVEDSSCIESLSLGGVSSFLWRSFIVLFPLRSHFSLFPCVLRRTSGNLEQGTMCILADWLGIGSHGIVAGVVMDRI